MNIEDVEVRCRAEEGWQCYPYLQLTVVQVAIGLEFNVWVYHFAGSVSCPPPTLKKRYLDWTFGLWW